MRGAVVPRAVVPSAFVPGMVLGIVLAAASSARAADLAELAGRYKRAVGSVGGAPDARQRIVTENVAPILAEIGGIASDAALQFLVGEYRTAKLTEVSAACAAPILAHASDAAPRLLLAEFPRRPPEVQRAVLEAVAKSERDLGAYDRELAQAISGELRAEVRSAAPAAVAKALTETTAKALLGLVKKPNAREADAARELARGATETLGAAKDDAVRRWLATEAFSLASREPDRLAVLLGAVEKLELAEAREEIVKLVSHRSDEVAAAAMRALSKLGIGDAAALVAKRLSKTRDLRARIDAMDALAASGDPGAIEAVVGHARGKDPELRAIALGSLGTLANAQPAALDALLEALEDKDPNVRSVAMRSLSRVRHKRMVAPLIAALGDKNPYAYRVKALEALVTATGQNMGLVQADWDKWWRFAEKDFEFPTGGGEGVTGVETYGLDYFGIEISSNRLAFVVDISSSMTQEVTVKKREGTDGGELEEGKAPKIDILKVELARVLGKLTPDSFVNIVLFDGNFRPWQKQLQPLAGPGRAKAIDFAKSINTGSGTNVFDSLEFALADERVDTIYLMTDGQPTRGRITQTDAIRAEVLKLNRLRAVTIHCIAFGEESKFLEELAAENGGKYRFVNEY